MKKLLVLALGMVFLLGAGGRLLAQPEATGYTLSDIYYYLTEGTEATWGNHSLEPQSGVPGQDIAGFSQSMEDIYYYMAEAYGQCNLSYDEMAQNYEEGKYFFCTDSNYWGVQEGTIPWELNETSCNALSGWYWYTTNGRSACWSKTLVDSVPWNRGVGADSDNPGSYTAAIGYTLKDRMEAAATGEWYKIVSEGGGSPISSEYNGASWCISALAIADCVDGIRDLCTGDGCLGSSKSAINTSLRDWAGAAGKSALPYMAATGIWADDNDYYKACDQNGGNDLPLDCADGTFQNNRKFCGEDNNRFCWAAACGPDWEEEEEWKTTARLMGANGCGHQGRSPTTNDLYVISFRVVVRP